MVENALCLSSYKTILLVVFVFTKYQHTLTCVRSVIYKIEYRSGNFDLGFTIENVECITFFFMFKQFLIFFLILKLVYLSLDLKKMFFVNINIK